jgi:hypothetical protein
MVDLNTTGVRLGRIACYNVSVLTMRYCRTGQEHGNEQA